MGGAIKKLGAGTELVIGDPLSAPVPGDLSLRSPTDQSGPSSGDLSGVAWQSEDEVYGFSADTLVRLRGRALELRPLTPDDYEAAKTVLARNRALLRAGGITVDDPADCATASSEAFRSACEMNEITSRLGTDYSFGIFLGDELIGQAILYGVRRGVVKSGLTCTWIDEAHRGAEHVEEAYFLLCMYGFDELGLNRIESAVLPENEAVQKALSKGGIPCEGLARDFLEVNGEPRDHLRYVLTRRDWEARRKALLSAWVE